MVTEQSTRVTSQMETVQMETVQMETVQNAPAAVTPPNHDYALVARAIQYLDTNFQQQPSLEELAAALYVSPFHLQRVFTRWAGISPKRFLQYLTLDYAKSLLGQSQNLLDTAYAAGLSSPGRLHDLFIKMEAVTPGEYKNRGAAIQIVYGRHTTPFGDCLLAGTARGVCALNFIDPDSDPDEDGAHDPAAGPDTRWEDAVDALYKTWGEATITYDPAQTAPIAARVFGRASERAAARASSPQSDPAQPDPAQSELKDLPPLRLLVKGTNFQVKVWEALLRIPMGGVATYAGIAQALDNPKAARAVGSAVGANAIAYLIPCHRVIRQSGAVHAYRWGATRKRAILGWEAARAGNP